MTKILTDKEIIKIGKHAGAIPHAADSYTLHGYITFAHAIEQALLDALNEEWTPPKYTLWSNEEEELLLKLLKDGYTTKEIADELGRSEGSTRGRYNYFRASGIIDFPTPGVIRNLTNAQKEEMVRLRKEQGLGYRKIAEIVSCSEKSVSRVLRDYRKDKPVFTMSTLNWTKEEDELLRSLVDKGVPNRKISERMGRSVYAVRKRRNELKIGSRRPKQASKYQPRFKPSGNPWLDIAG